LNPFAHFSLAPTGTVRENPTQFDSKVLGSAGLKGPRRSTGATTNRSGAGKNSKA